MLTNARTVCASLLLLHVAVPSYAQRADVALSQYSVASWTDRDGLPSNQIRALAQDTEGYLWVGTSAGLVRFDGVTFVDWQVPEAPNLIASEVTALCAARDGSLWVGINEGHVIRLRHGEVVSFTPDAGLPVGYVGRLLEDREGTIWAAGSGGLSRFRGDRWERVGPGDGFPEAPVLTLYEDRVGGLWITTTTFRVWRRAPGSAKFEQMLLSLGGQSLAEESGVFLTADSGRAYRRLVEASADSGAALGGIDGVAGEVLLRDRRGHLWVATQGQGLIRVHGRILSEHPLSQRFTVADGLADNVVTTVLEDREANVWAGTLGGLSRVSRVPIPLAVTSAQQLLQTAATTDGSIWGATTTGLIRFRNGQEEIYGLEQGLPGLEVTGLQADPRGALWITTRDHLAPPAPRWWLPTAMARLAHGRIERIPLPPALQSSTISTMTTDPDGGMLFWATERGLFRWKDGTISLASANTFGEKWVGVLHADRNRGIWIGFMDGGLARLRGADIETYREKDGLAAGRIIAIAEDEGGTLWIATAMGVSRFRNGTFDTLPSRRMRTNALTAMAEDESGDFWLGTSTGIVHLPRSEFERAVADPSYEVRSRLFDEADGVRGRPAVGRSPMAVRASDGTICFVTTSGLVMINPDQLPESRRPPVVRIESVTADDRVLAPEPGIELPPLTSHLEINYSALTLSPMTLRFHYKMEGVDRDWIASRTQGRVSYNTGGLAPGEYRFRVAAEDNAGVWSEPVTTWHFSVRPAFYQTRWFYAVSALVGGLTLWAAWRVRLTHERSKLANLKLDFVAAVTHDLKTPITTIRAAGQTIFFGRANPDMQHDCAGIIVQESQRLARSVENLLAASRVTDASSIYRFEQLFLDTVINDSLVRFRSLQDRTCEFDVDIEPSVPPLVGDRQALGLAIDNLIDNAIRYSKDGGQVTIRVHSTADAVCLEIGDRGRGIPADEIEHVTRSFYRGRNATPGGSGLGLAIAKRVIDGHGGTLKISSAINVGTTVSVVLPVTQDA